MLWLALSIASPVGLVRAAIVADLSAAAAAGVGAQQVVQKYGLEVVAKQPASILQNKKNGFNEKFMRFFNNKLKINLHSKTTQSTRNISKLLLMISRG